LEEHDGTGAHHLIIGMAVFENGTDTHDEDGDRVNERIEKPSVGWMVEKSLTDRMEEQHDRSSVPKIIGTPIEDHVKTGEKNA
jgi:hypothetical protein